MIYDEMMRCHPFLLQLTMIIIIYARYRNIQRMASVDTITERSERNMSPPRHHAPPPPGANSQSNHEPGSHTSNRSSQHMQQQSSPSEGKIYIMYVLFYSLYIIFLPKKFFPLFIIASISIHPYYIHSTVWCKDNHYRTWQAHVIQPD